MSNIVGRIERILERFHVKHGRLPKTSGEILAVKREAVRREISSGPCRIRTKQA